MSEQHASKHADKRKEAKNVNECRHAFNERQISTKYDVDEDIEK